MQKPHQIAIDLIHPKKTLVLQARGNFEVLQLEGISLSGINFFDLLFRIDCPRIVDFFVNIPQSTSQNTGHH